MGSRQYDGPTIDIRARSLLQLSSGAVAYSRGTSDKSASGNWKSFRVSADEGTWEPASYNIQTENGEEYGRWRRVLRKHPDGLTVISRYKAPPGKAWKIVGKASELGEEVYIMAGAYYDAHGRILAGPGTYLFNAPGARHGGISCDLTLFIHCCSGEPDEIVSIDLIDFEPKENP
jgi:hypothetical protein